MLCLILGFIINPSPKSRLHHATWINQLRLGPGWKSHLLWHTKTKEIGFDCIDIFADPLDTDAKERKLIRTECEKAGLPIISVACVATGLIDFNPSVQRFHMDRCNKYLDMCYEFEAKNLLLVLGEYIWEKQVIPPQEQWNTAVHNTRELGKYAQGLGLQIAIELEPFKLSLVNNVESMVRFLNEVNHPAVKANIDISHLLLSNTPASELKTYRQSHPCSYQRLRW